MRIFIEYRVSPSVPGSQSSADSDALLWSSACFIAVSHLSSGRPLSSNPGRSRIRDDLGVRPVSARIPCRGWMGFGENIFFKELNFHHL